MYMQCKRLCICNCGYLKYYYTFVNMDNSIIEDFEDLILQDCFYEGEYQTQPITIETSKGGEAVVLESRYYNKKERV